MFRETPEYTGLGILLAMLIQSNNGKPINKPHINFIINVNLYLFNVNNFKLFLSSKKLSKRSTKVKVGKLKNDKNKTTIVRK